jgi:hypothetical protein
MSDSWKINQWVLDNSSWLPMVLSRNVFIISFVFYVVISVLSRATVKRIWVGNNDKEAEAGGFASQTRKRDTVGRWTPSLIHAAVATITATCATFGLLPQNVLCNEDVIMHSLGYFLGDLLVDRDPDYIMHHVGPILHSECMLRLGAQFWHAMRAGYIMEAGNVIAHTAAVLTFRKGTLFHKLNTWSFWISRPASYYDGFMAWYTDIPASGRWTIMGVIPLLGILGVYFSNTKWMIAMCRTRRPKPRSSLSTSAVPATAQLSRGGSAKLLNGHNGEHEIKGLSNGNGHVKSS